MVEQDGSIHFGTFRLPFRHANILDAPVHSFPVPNCWKRFRLKEWQHFGIVTPTHYFGFVIFDAKFTGLSFFYVYDRLKNIRFEHTRQGIGHSIKVAGQVYDDVCWFDAKGYHLRFKNKLDQGFHRILIDIDGHQDCLAVKGDITIHEDLDAIEPLVQLSPITAAKPFYTHKAAVPASGEIMLGSQEIVLQRETSIALIDEQKTYYPYFSFWKWATAAGYNDNGKLLAFNLCQNMIADDEDFNENCVWLDGKIYCLKGAQFEFQNVMHPWNMKTTDDRLDLMFSPIDERAQKISIGGLLKSDFHQPFGLYNGAFRDDQGVRYSIKDYFGLAEHHITRY
jgi:hypothetical protein